MSHARPTTQEVDAALALFANADLGPTMTLVKEVLCLRHDLEYERTLRNGLERMLKTLDTQLTAADEVLP